MNPLLKPGNSKETTVVERRRPGRIETKNPHLISLYRRPVKVSTAADDQIADQLPTRTQDEEITDPLAAARGIALGIVISIPIWVLIGLAAWSLL